MKEIDKVKKKIQNLTINYRSSNFFGKKFQQTSDFLMSEKSNKEMDKQRINDKEKRQVDIQKVDKKPKFDEKEQKTQFDFSKKNDTIREEGDSQINSKSSERNNDKTKPQNQVLVDFKSKTEKQKNPKFEEKNNNNLTQQKTPNQSKDQKEYLFSNQIFDGKSDSCEKTISLTKDNVTGTHSDHSIETDIAQKDKYEALEDQKNQGDVKNIRLNKFGKDLDNKKVHDFMVSNKNEESSSTKNILTKEKLDQNLISGPLEKRTLGNTHNIIYNKNQSENKNAVQSNLLSTKTNFNEKDLKIDSFQPFSSNHQNNKKISNLFSFSNEKSLQNDNILKDHYNNGSLNQISGKNDKDFNESPSKNDKSNNNRIENNVKLNKNDDTSNLFQIFTQNQEKSNTNLGKTNNFENVKTIINQNFKNNLENDFSDRKNNKNLNVQKNQVDNIHQTSKFDKLEDNFHQKNVKKLEIKDNFTKSQNKTLFFDKFIKDKQQSSIVDIGKIMASPKKDRLSNLITISSAQKLFLYQQSDRFPNDFNKFLDQIKDLEQQNKILTEECQKLQKIVFSSVKNKKNEENELEIDELEKNAKSKKVKAKNDYEIRSNFAFIFKNTPDLKKLDSIVGSFKNLETIQKLIPKNQSSSNEVKFLNMSILKLQKDVDYLNEQIAITEMERNNYLFSHKKSCEEIFSLRSNIDSLKADIVSLKGTIALLTDMIIRSDNSDLCDEMTGILNQKNES